MPRSGIEPVTRGFSVLCSTNWSIWAFIKQEHEYLCFVHPSCEDRIWTCDLRVMSPTSFQTAPPRDIKLIWLSFQINQSGGKWIRTTESTANRFTVCPLWPLGNSPINNYLRSVNGWCSFHFPLKPMIGLEPITCWLQISCSANWATSALNSFLLYKWTL